MPEREKQSFVDRLVEGALQGITGAIGKSVQGIVKHLLRLAGLILAGVAISIVGVVFLAIGVVKWFSILMPDWLAWLIVGIILFLVGLAVTMITIVSSRT